jgi:polysaccharide biosynthesis/export protein
MIRLLLLFTILFSLSSCQSLAPNFAKDQSASKNSSKSMPLSSSNSSLQNIPPLVNQASLIVSSDNTQISDSIQPYRIGPGDQFDLIETRIPLLNRRYQVAPDGSVIIPILGSQKLAEKTPDEALTLLQDQLKKLYREPELSLVMASYTNYRITIFGDVLNPGEYIFNHEPNILHLLSRAGGLKNDPQYSTAIVTRGSNEFYKIALKDLIQYGKTELDIKLLPQDKVHILSQQERGYHLMGEVKTPGYFPLESEMTLLRAINKAGGLGESANTAKIELIRPLDNEQPIIITIDLSALAKGKLDQSNQLIQAGDIIYVSTSVLGRINYYLRQINPGLNMILLGDAINRVKNN